VDLPSLEIFYQTWNLQLQCRNELHVKLAGILELCNSIYQDPLNSSWLTNDLQ